MGFAPTWLRHGQVSLDPPRHMTTLSTGNYRELITSTEWGSGLYIRTHSLGGA